MNVAKLLFVYIIFSPNVAECWLLSKILNPTFSRTPPRIMHSTSHFFALQCQERCGLHLTNSKPHIRISSSKDENQESQPTKSLGTAIDDFGKALKLEAQKASRSSTEATSKLKKVLHSILSSSYYMAFVLYRAYRGVFVLSPAVFRRVYVKLDEAIGSDLPKTSDNESGNVSYGSWRTRLTVSTLAVIVTFSYFLGGCLRSISKFFKTIKSTTSVSTSFEAMIEEISDHEKRVG